MFYRCAHSAQCLGVTQTCYSAQGLFFSFFVLFLEFGALRFFGPWLLAGEKKKQVNLMEFRFTFAISDKQTLKHKRRTHARRHRVCIDNTNAAALSLYLLLFCCYRLVVGQFQVSIEHSSVCRRCLVFRCRCWWWVVFFPRVCFYTIPLLALLCTTCTTAITVSWILALDQLISSSCAISFSSHVAFQDETQESANKKKIQKKKIGKNKKHFDFIHYWIEVIFVQQVFPM